MCSATLSDGCEQSQCSKVVVLHNLTALVLPSLQRAEGVLRGC